MKKLTTLLLAALLTSGLFAQNLTGKISGNVTSDGQALAGANVILEGTTRTRKNRQYTLWYG